MKPLPRGFHADAYSALRSLLRCTVVPAQSPGGFKKQHPQPVAIPSCGNTDVWVPVGTILPNRSSVQARKCLQFVIRAGIPAHTYPPFRSTCLQPSRRTPPSCHRFSLVPPKLPRGLRRKGRPVFCLLVVRARPSAIQCLPNARTI